MSIYVSKITVQAASKRPSGIIVTKMTAQVASKPAPSTGRRRAAAIVN